MNNYKLVGVGFGPSNIALSIALESHGIKGATDGYFKVGVLLYSVIFTAI
ncbi:hypothetical protein [Gynuella sunshinyii]|nr:hypothetical protein [Gynuella sunshinyii]